VAEDAIRLQYAWNEEDYLAYQQANWRFCEVFRPALAEHAKRMLVSGFAYNVYYFGPAFLSTLCVGFWFALFPEARPQNPLPTLIVIFIAVVASVFAGYRLYHWLAGQAPDSVRVHFDAYKGFEHDLRLDAEGFLLKSMTTEARFSWRAAKLLVEVWGNHLIILHPMMILIIPGRASSVPLADLAATVSRWRDAA
jgi:hypothetical protein